MIAYIHLAIEKISGSNKFSLSWEGDLTSESLQINWLDTKIPKPSNASVFEMYNEIVAKTDRSVKEAAK